MPTISPDPSPTPGAAAHQLRHVAESFGADAARYDRARPEYPAALVERITATSPGRDVLDVGCGTGIAARQFQAAGCRVLGVDPDVRMADLARRSGVDVETSRFEDWDPAGRQFDAVIAAQAWHWVDPVAGAARAAGVLRPGGLLAVFWNVFSPPARIGEAFAAAHRAALGESTPNFWDRPALPLYLAGCDKVDDGVRRSGAFGEPRRWRFTWERSYTRDEWLDTLPTLAGIGGRLPPAVMAELLAATGAAIDAAGGGFTMAYTTVTAAAVRAGGAG